MTNKVPGLDIKAELAPIKEEILEAVHRVIDSGAFILGPDVAEMEKDVAAYCQTKHCLGVSSGSDALILALMALDVQPGDEIITTPYTFFATAGAVSRLGAKPVFVDIDPVTFNINPSKIEEKITAKTKAIIPVHLYGQCADMNPILEVAKAHKLPVIEDGAQAIGAEYHGRRAGSMGDIGCFSFFPSKNLGAFGDGGAVTTNNDELAEKMRVLRVHGSKPKYHHHVIGGNFRLDTIHAAVIRVKLKSLDSWTRGRQELAERYTQLMQEKGLCDQGVVLPSVVENRHIFNQFVIRVPKRDELQKHLSANGIANAIYYPIPMHLQGCFSYLGHQEGDFPESERAANETLAIPIYPQLSEDQQDLVVEALCQFYYQQGSQSTRHAA